MIEEAYVSFEVAKLLKEKGFDEYGTYFYTLKDEGCEGYKSNRTLGEFAHNSDPNLKDRAVSCPTQQMAMKWLREVHNIMVSPYALSLGYYFEIFDLTTKDITGCKPLYKVGIPSKEDVLSTYEEAIEAGIKYCLENLI